MQILKFIFQCFVRHPEPAAIVEQVQPLPAAVIRIDPRIQSIKQIAAMRLSRKRVPIEMAAGLSDRTTKWLLTLTTEMLLLVTSAPYSRLREHLACGKAIRGLLAADADSIAAYRETLRPRMSMFDTEGGRRGGGGPKRSVGGMKL